jgi:hypothetical protein
VRGSSSDGLGDIDTRLWGDRFVGALFAGGTRLLGSALLGEMPAIGVPGAVQARVSLAVRWAIRDVAAGDPTALVRLRAWYRFAHRDRLVWSYAAERDPVRRRRLADAHKEPTGEDVESRLARIVD